MYWQLVKVHFDTLIQNLQFSQNKLLHNWNCNLFSERTVYFFKAPNDNLRHILLHIQMLSLWSNTLINKCRFAFNVKNCLFWTSLYLYFLFAIYSWNSIVYECSIPMFVVIVFACMVLRFLLISAYLSGFSTRMHRGCRPSSFAEVSPYPAEAKDQVRLPWDT